MAMQFSKKKDNLDIEYCPKINGENLNLMELQKPEPVKVMFP